MSDDKMIKEEVIDVVNWNCAEDNVVQQQQGEAEDGDEDSDVDVDLRSRFRCNFCSFTTVYPRNIIQHQRFVHGGERPYECPHCDWKFAKSYSLRLHIASKHNDVACNSNNNNSGGGGSFERKPKRKADEMEDETGDERKCERVVGEEPKPPPNGFMLWLRENHNKVKMSVTAPGNSSKETLIEAGKRWKAMSSDRRCEYKMRAMEIRQKYYAKYPKTSSGPSRKSVLFVSGSSNQRQKQRLDLPKTESMLKVPYVTSNAAAGIGGRTSQVVQQLHSQQVALPPLPPQQQQRQQWPVISAAATTSTVNGGNQLQFTLPPHLLADPQQQYVIVIPMMQQFPTTTTTAAATNSIQSQQIAFTGQQHPSTEFPSDVKFQINASSQQTSQPATLERVFRCSNCQREFASNSEAVAHLNGVNCTATNSKPGNSKQEPAADLLIPAGSSGNKSAGDGCKKVKIEVIEID